MNKCSGSSPTASVCYNKQVGQIVPNVLAKSASNPDGSIVCTRTTNDWCSALPKQNVTGQDTDGDGIIDGSVQPGNLENGGCPYVITCNCGGTVKQHCAYSNTWGSNNVGTHCQQNVCPAVGGAKVCEPGTIKCTTGVKGVICNGNGTAWGTDEVNAHACGATGSQYTKYCVANPSTGQAGNVCYNSQSECQSRHPGTTCLAVTDTYTPGTEWCSRYSVNSLDTGSCWSTESECNANKQVGTVCYSKAGTTCKANEYSRRFLGCGAASPQGGKKNCYNICDFGTLRTNVCVDEPGLSCGATGNVSVPSPIPSPAPGSSPQPPASPNVPASPQPGQCVSISKSVTTPKIGDSVSFTCAPVNLASRYEFRFAYTTSATVAESEYQALQPTSATANTSSPITVDRVGRYVAMCRPCFGNNQCETWQVAQLQNK